MNEAARRQSSVGWVGGDEWDVHKSTISDLYQTQNLPLKDVMKVMEDRHGFRATQRMYKTRIKSWGLDKNFKECEVVELFRLRRERERAGKTSTRYMLRGREVDWDRVQNYVRRKGLNISQLLAANDTAPLARDINCTTPPPCCGRDHGDHHRREPVGGASPPSSSPSPSAQSISSSHYEAGFAVPSASNCTQQQQQQQPSPISPATVNSSVLKTTTPMTAHPAPRRPPPPLLPKPSPHRRASYPLPPPRTTGPLHHRNQYQQPFLPFQPTASTLADSIVVQNDNDTNQLESFQLFLTRLYKNTMFQDGDKAWGTTEYWLRNTRSLEWFMGIRYKLALHRNQIFSSPAPPSGSRLKQFQILNRAFAVLEPLSRGVIPSRMWYVMNFIAGFVPSGEGESNQQRQVGRDQEVFRETIDKMLVEIQKKCGRPPSGMAVSPSATGFKVEETKQTLVCMDEMMMMDIDDDEEYDRNRVYDNDGVRRKGWYFGENAGFHETAMRFLLEILEKMYENLMASGSGSGSPLAMEAALLLEEDRKGYPVCRGNWRPESYDRAAASRMSISSVSSNWQSSLLSPVSPADGSSAAEMLESAVWLLSREEDAKAEVQLRALIELAEQQGGKSSGLLPSPNRTLGLGGFGMEHSSSGGVRLAQAKAFARCAHYHLSRIYRRQGYRAAASEHLRLSVEGSLLFDEFVGWEEVEFLFA